MDSKKEYQRYMKNKIRLLKLQLLHDHRAKVYRKMMFDKYLVTLRYRKPKGVLSEED